MTRGFRSIGRRMNRFIFFIGIFSLLLSTGCATLFSNKEDTITIKTEPPGAEVYRGAQGIEPSLTR